MTWNWKAPSLWQRCLVALLIVAAASAVRARFFGDLGRGIPYLTCYPAVMLAALYGGLLPGFLATVVSGILCFFWIQRGFMSPVETLALVVFFISCTMICIICEAMHRAQAQAKAARENAEAAYQELRSAVAEGKRAEAEIRRLNFDLEQRVHDRTAELEAANRESEAFSYSVSHDLRAPLRAIDGFAHILTEDYQDRLDPEGRRVLRVISNETQRMGQLVDDLLAFSRLGRQKIESADINLAALVKAVFDEQAAQAPKRNLQLELQSVPAAQGDRSMIRVVLTNLLANAIKFTKHRDPGLIEVGFTEKWCNGAADSIEDPRIPAFFVRDNGVGFDMKYAHKLFGVFQRLHSEDEFEGTGVGLALVQRIIHRHGGRVWAEAKVNEGATFYFSLPNAQRKL